MPFGTICDILRENQMCFDLREFILVAFRSPNWGYDNTLKLLENECRDEEQVSKLHGLFLIESD